MNTDRIPFDQVDDGMLERAARTYVEITGDRINAGHIAQQMLVAALEVPLPDPVCSDPHCPCREWETVSHGGSE